MTKLIRLLSVLFVLAITACASTNNNTAYIKTPFGVKAVTDNRYGNRREATNVFGTDDGKGNDLTKMCISNHAPTYGTANSWDYCTCLADKEAHIANGHAVDDCRRHLFAGGAITPANGSAYIGTPYDPNLVNGTVIATPARQANAQPPADQAVIDGLLRQTERNRQDLIKLDRRTNASESTSEK